MSIACGWRHAHSFGSLMDLVGQGCLLVAFFVDVVVVVWLGMVGMEGLADACKGD